MVSNGSTAETLDELVQRAKSSKLQADESVARHHAAQMDHWRKLAGPALEQMLQSRQAAHSFLIDDDPKRRMTALDVLSRHWKPDADLAATAEKMAFGDADPDVRNAAVLVLGDCYCGSDDARISQLFAGIVRGSAHAEQFRKWAYLGLCKVTQSIRDWPDLANFCFPDDVDWNVVDRVLAVRAQ
jgi:hypothetical protein